MYTSKYKDFVESISLLELLKTRRNTKYKENIKTIILLKYLKILTRRESIILGITSPISISIISRPLYVTKKAY